MVTSFNTKRKNEIDLTSKMLDGGERSIEKICGSIGMSRSTFWKNAKLGRYEVPSDVIFWREPRYDDLIDRGLNTAEISIIAGRTRQAVHHFIVNNGRKEHWERCKQQRKQLGEKGSHKSPDVREDLLGLIKAHAYQLASAKGQPYVRALDWAFEKERFRDATPHSSLVEMIDLYFSAQQEGREVTLNEFSRAIGRNPSTVKNLLAYVGLKPKLRKQFKTSDEKKEILARSIETGMAVLDVAYFANVPPNVAQRLTKRRKSFQKLKRIDCLPYRIASQIYEAEDLGFNREEIKELLGVGNNTLNSALINKELISGQIISALKVMYNDPKIDKPYLETKL